MLMMITDENESSTYKEANDADHDEGDDDNDAYGIICDCEMLLSFRVIYDDLHYEYTVLVARIRTRK